MNEYNWYKNKNKYRYRDYKIIDGRGKYFNEDSGKWVTSLRNKVIEEKYIRYEFSQYDDREIEVDFGYQNIERVSKFLSTLYKRSIEIERRYGSKFISIESAYIKGILSQKEHKLIINKLHNELGVIDVKIIEGKGFKKASFNYKLNDDFFKEDCYKRIVYIRNTRISRFLDNHYKREVFEDKYLKYEVSVCRRLDLYYDEFTLIELFKERLNIEKEKQEISKDWDFYTNKKRSEIAKIWDKEREDEYLRKLRLSFEILCFDINELRNGGVNYKGFSSSRTAGRVTNFILHHPKEFRRLLKIDGEELIEIDMKSAYPSLMYRIVLGIRDVKVGESLFDDKIKECVGKIDLEEFIQEYECVFKKGSTLDFYDIITKKIGEDVNLIDDSRRYLKGLILKLLNANTSELKSKRYIKDAYSYDELMILIFTKNVKQVIERIKNYEFRYKSGEDYYGYNLYKNMSRILMNLESMIMKGIWDIMIEKGIDYISLYDGMLVKEKDKREVREIIDSELVGFSACIRMSFKE